MISNFDMELLDSITIITQGGEIKNIELYHGDLVSPYNTVKFDLLVTSAFYNDYAPLPGTLIGALDNIGIALRSLVKTKKHDLREYFSCWMTEVPNNLEKAKKVSFSKILCYESAQKGPAWKFIGGVFQAIMPFIFEPPGIKTIAMPVLSSGNQGYDNIKMLDAIMQSACTWLKNGMPVEKILIVEVNPKKANELKNYFRLFKEKHNYNSKTEINTSQYDLFMSYSRSNQTEIDFFINAIKEVKPKARLFIDRFEIDPGSSWQQKIFEALDNCIKVITFLSPQYLSSEICKEEYNIARLRSLKAKRSIIQPILLYSTTLPTYMETIHYHDCREADKQKLLTACDQIIATLGES